MDDAPLWSGTSDSLEVVCGELNFKDSLVREACGLRDRTVRVLTDLHRHYEGAGMRLDLLAACAGPGPRRERLLAAARRSRANLETVRRRRLRLLELDLGEPRATV